ncbi:MAG: type II secretion system protein [bacterium]|nr:type II secretion system protein [bacterium]
MSKQKGFTLLELVIVIGILAVLGAVSVLVLNPAQLFAQARDTTRIQDIGVLRNALGLYVSTASSPTMGVTANCYVYNDGDTDLDALAANCGGRHSGGSTLVTSRAVDSNGWVPVNFASVPGGPALSVLPVDPTNNGTYFYSYANDNTTSKTFELDAKLESDRYTTGADNKEATDGGNKPAMYEVGTDNGLDL